MNFGDVVTVDLGVPVGSEAGFLRPGIVVTADSFLRFRPTSVFVVPLTTTRRPFPSHVEVEPDEASGLTTLSWAQVEQLRAVAIERCSAPSGNVGPASTHQILDILAMITGMP